jgi:hypothetical protein
MQGQPISIRLSKASGKGTGESLKHLDNASRNAVVIGDRAYGTPSGLAHAMELGLSYIVRFTWNHLPVFDTMECTKRILPEQELSEMKCGEIRELTA